MDFGQGAAREVGREGVMVIFSPNFQLRSVTARPGIAIRSLKVLFVYSRGIYRRVFYYTILYSYINFLKKSF